MNLTPKQLLHHLSVGTSLSTSMVTFVAVTTLALSSCAQTTATQGGSQKEKVTKADGGELSKEAEKIAAMSTQDLLKYAKRITAERDKLEDQENGDFVRWEFLGEVRKMIDIEADKRGEAADARSKAADARSKAADARWEEELVKSAAADARWEEELVKSAAADARSAAADARLKELDEREKHIRAFEALIEAGKDMSR